ncbi:hypothetical protein ACVOMT_16575 [Sphingomonas panni]
MASCSPDAESGELLEMMTELPPLETNCEKCGGAGMLRPRREGTVIYQGGQCDTCRGAGKLPTEAGNAVIAFIRNQQRARNL